MTNSFLPLSCRAGYRDYSRENLERIAKELDLSVKLVKEYILGGLDNENVVSMDEEIDEETGHTIEELMADRESSAEKMCFRLLRWDSMVAAFASLTPRQKNIVASRCGICERCFGTTKKLEFQDIATNNGLISAEAVEKAYKKATTKMREYVRRNYG